MSNTTRTYSPPPQRSDAPRIRVTWIDTFGSPLGWIAWQGTDIGVTHLTLGHPSEVAARQALARSPQVSSFPDWFPDAQKKLQSYCLGHPQDLSLIPVETHDHTNFASRVVQALMQVRYGETVSYLELAERAGSPRAARAVGTVMSQNSVPLIIPCHRVIGSGGKLGGYSAPQGLTMKRLLLELESSGPSSRQQ